MNQEINIQVDDLFQKLIDKSQLGKVVEVTLETAGSNTAVELGVVVTDDEKIHELNLKYRGLDEPTDVISFALLENKEPFVMPPDNILHLGEVIVSYPRAVTQAQEQNHSVDKELTHLIIHGVLHLLEYDHENDEDDHKMRAIETQVLSAISK